VLLGAARVRRRINRPARGCCREVTGPTQRLPIEHFFDDQSIRQAVISRWFDGRDDRTEQRPLQHRGARYQGRQAERAGSLQGREHQQCVLEGQRLPAVQLGIDGHEIPLLASVDLQGKSYRRIIEPRRTKDDFSIFFGNLVDRFVASDEHILITGYTSESDARKINPSAPRNPTPTVYKVNVRTGRRAQIVGLDQGYSAGWFDREGNQRLTTLTEGKELSFRIRERNDQPWQVIKTFDATDVRWDVMGLLSDGPHGLSAGLHHGGSRSLAGLGFGHGSVERPGLHSTRRRIVAVRFSPKRDRLLGVTYQGARSHTHWLDERWKVVIQTIEAQYPEHEVAITSIADDEKRFVFVVYSDRDRASMSWRT